MHQVTIARLTLTVCRIKGGAMRVGSVLFDLPRGPVPILLSNLALCALCAPAVAQLPLPSGSLPSLSETERSIHLLSRATYGVRPSDVEELLRIGRDQWIELQLNPGTIVEDGLNALKSAPTRAGPGTVPNAMTTPVRALGVGIPESLIIDKLMRAAYSRRQLQEVMTDFWFNHFNVYFSKAEMRGAVRVIPHYERVAIRQYVFSRFEDMLQAVAGHPAMLIYLDNYLSRKSGPDFPGGEGINENYARELLELHTLGVDGGFTEQDVIEVARAFTGWSVEMAPHPTTGVLLPTPSGNALEYKADWHDAATKVVLGHTLAAGRGLEDGREVLALLARHPSTAHHIATKLVRHFVADQPPPDLVRDIADVFLESDGDLREVTRALFTSDAFYRPEHYRAKLKRPFELLASTLRLTGAQPAGGRITLELLNDFHHVPYNYPAPTGYPMSAEDWIGASSLLSRVNFGLAVSAGEYLESPVDAWTLLGIPEGETHALVASNTAGVLRYDTRAITRSLLAVLLCGIPSPALESAIDEDLAQQDTADFSALVMRGLGFLLGSADFQRH